MFRNEAVVSQTRRLEGEVVLAQPVQSRVLGIAGMIVVVAGLAFVSTATYARMESVTGWVVPEGGLIRVGARQAGIVERIDVAEGDEVQAGQPLALVRVSSDFSGGNAGVLIADQLRAEAEAAEAQATAAREQLLAEQEQVTAQREALSLELAESRSGLSTLVERAELLSGNVGRAEQLAERGVFTQRNLEEARMAELVARQEVSQARAAILSYERQIGELDARARSLPLEIEAATAQARISQAALAQRQTEAAVRHSHVVGATVAGRVVAVPVSLGQDVAAGAMIAAITPAGSSLEAELFIPSRAAGFIQSGQEVRLMYQAFPYQKFGTGRGTVQQVSRTVLGPGDISVPGLELREPVFRVKVRLERDSVNAYGQEIPIQPGMLLSADVVIDRRTLLEWLLDPLYAVGRMG
ncbi:HlyD family secretion protein [Aureimonas populi]|uniref:HlyD family secretion protein n=1 Tax=Aureimonas populi TaxID=1701758 RepID=A0ABW5CK61_9HYPH|nr:HlyD family efflux transporter periplasmic adaptor subunit [Aureimonas populi]